MANFKSNCPKSKRIYNSSLLVEIGKRANANRMAHFKPIGFGKKSDPTTINITIEGWDDFFKKDGKTAASTANANVSILTDSFYIPQLDRYRRVWMYLPSDYHNSDKRYPVLYMHDGQNVFDAATSYSGEWQADEILLQLEKNKGFQVIVVAIDNGQKHRMSEYNPWNHVQYGGGEGGKYIDFIAQTLKPAIDKKFRTKPEREHTGVMGSSMGGLISMYAIMAYPDVFSKAGVFSPSFWISNGKAYSQATKNANPSTMKIYMLMGKKEGRMMVKGQKKMTKKLRRKGFNSKSMQSVTVKDGIHNESFWAKEFEKAIIWLFDI